MVTAAVAQINPLLPEERLSLIARCVLNQWHWAPDRLTDCYWSSRIAVHPVNDPESPTDAFRVIFEEDFHHNSRCRALYLDANGAVTRTTVAADREVDGPQISRIPDDVILLMDTVLRALPMARLVSIKK